MCARGVNCSLILDVDGPVHVGAHGLAQQPCQAIRLYRQVVGTEGASFWQRGLTVRNGEWKTCSLASVHKPVLGYQLRRTKLSSAWSEYASEIESGMG